ncbi:hypothetical protein M970_041180 [Encephalitozoon cuniculi EcunIII-L]|nr:hypothetical protein M970_041180 [Encephalitozoon cuniculi EcunIII-L]
MDLEKEVTIQVNLMEPKEIDLRKKTKQKKRRQRTDEYDYNDPFIEPFEGETEMVMIECNLEDFFVYKGELPYSAKKVLSVHKAKEKSRLAKSSNTDPCPQEAGGKKEGTGGSAVSETPTKRRRGKIPKSDTKICDCLAGLIKSEVDRLELSIQSESTEVERYVHLMILETFQQERGIEFWHIAGPKATKRPSDEEMARCLREKESRMDVLFDAIAREIRNYDLYSDDLSLFKGFQKEDFLFNACEYFLLFIKISFLSQKDMSFNRARKEAYGNILALFPDTCRNSTQAQYYLAKHISQTCGIRGLGAPSSGRHEGENAEDDVSSNLERME